MGNPGLTKDEEALVDDGNDGTDTGSTASTVIAIPTYAFSKKAELVTPATAAGVAVFSASFFAPLSPSCVTTTHAAGSPMVQYVFADCTGPFGLVALNGEIDVTFQAPASGAGVDFVVTSPSTAPLTLNGAPVTLTGVQGNIVVDETAGTRTLTWTGDYKSKTLRGFDVDHSASYVIVADTGTSCVTVDGTSRTVITKSDGDHGFTTTVTGYHHCGARTRCPDGGTIELTTLDGKLKLTVEFLGGAVAKITSPRGTIPDWPLKCTP